MRGWKMKDIFNYFDFYSELEENSEILCPECEEWSHQSDWFETEVGCEDCGSHLAMGCPVCDERFDTILYGKTFETRLKSIT
jgi:Zn finger protein HypA/HybF involved in hydrogenase expression